MLMDLGVLTQTVISHQRILPAGLVVSLSRVIGLYSHMSSTQRLTANHVGEDLNCVDV